KTPSVPSVATAGDRITYTVTVVNEGNVTLAGVVVTDTRCPPAVRSGQAGGDLNGNGLLDVGETWTYQCTYTVTQADVDRGSILNTATVTATDPHGTSVSGSAGSTVTVDGSGHLTVTKTPSVPTVKKAGDPVTYTVTVLNDGNVTLSAVTVIDPRCPPVL